MKPFSLIVAMDRQRGIGKSGTLPWHLPGDMKHFKQLTTTTDKPQEKNVVIMGRKTWDSIPTKFKPLAQRINLVLTRRPTLSLPPEVLYANSLKKALSLLENAPYREKIAHIFVIGGQQIFETALQNPACESVYLTQIEKSFECDAFFPDFEAGFECRISSATFQENGISYSFSKYQKRATTSVLH